MQIKYSMNASLISDPTDGNKLLKTYQQNNKPKQQIVDKK